MNVSREQIRDWYTPDELPAAVIPLGTRPAAASSVSSRAQSRDERSQVPTDKSPSTGDSSPLHASGARNDTQHSDDTRAAQNESPRNDSGMLDKLLPLIGKINNGGLDISTMLDLLDKSGQGFGALGKLLPVITPLLQNFKKKPQQPKDIKEIIDYDTVNLD